MNHAVRLDLILANPCDRVTPPKPAEFRPTLWTIEETTRFLAECRRSEPEHYPFFLTAVATGARSGELLGLQWRHVDLDAGTIRITQELVRDGPGFQFSDPKSARSKRTIRLPREVTDELRVLRRHHVEERLRRGICAQDGTCWDQHCPFWHDHDLVFGQPNGKPGHANNLRCRVMRHICERAKVPVVRLHDLRHAHGSLLAASGVNLKVITERLGHASEGFTLSKYIQVTDMQEQAARVMSARLLSNQSLINPGAVW